MDDVIKFFGRLVAGLGFWGYVILGAAATLECAAFVGLLVPGESLVLLAGFFADRGALDLEYVIIAVVAGAIIGDSIGYELGRRLGHPWLERHGRKIGLKPARLERTEKFFKKHGGKAVFFGRFVGFVRTLVPFFAGASEMRYPVFLLYNASGGLLWGVGSALLGYGLGASWHVAEKWLGRGSLILAGLAVAAFVGWRLWRHISTRSRR
jgi:undecaprenyl-diphosphatase